MNKHNYFDQTFMKLVQTVTSFKISRIVLSTDDEFKDEFLNILLGHFI